MTVSIQLRYYNPLQGPGLPTHFVVSPCWTCYPSRSGPLLELRVFTSFCMVHSGIILAPKLFLFKLIAKPPRFHEFLPFCQILTHFVVSPSWICYPSRSGPRLELRFFTSFCTVHSGIILAQKLFLLKHMAKPRVFTSFFSDHFASFLPISWCHQVGLVAHQDQSLGSSFFCLWQV